MKNAISLIYVQLPLMLSLISGCGAQTKVATDLKFDAAHSVALDGVISAGRILTASRDDSAIESEIRRQLEYSVGQLNGLNSVSRLTLNPIKILSKRELPDANGLAEIKYAAQFLIAWDRYRSIPSELNLVIPAHGDRVHLQYFLSRFSGNCINEDGRRHGVTTGSYWYYYRPDNCGLAQNADSDLVSVFPMRLSMSAENSDGKSPEYAKIWEDGQLTVTALFAKYEASGNPDTDYGVEAYNNMYWWLLQRFGAPQSSNVTVPQGYNPGAQYPNIQMVFRSERGPVDVNIILIDDISTVNDEFKERYNARTRISDFVSYSGHSGVGANVRAFAALGQFVQGKYQLFMINGCDSFAYSDNTLRDAHAAVNPGAGPSKYFDLITNSMPSYFSNNAQANMSVLNALLTSRMSYRVLLSSFDINQRAVVTGEEDNAWPKQF